MSESSRRWLVAAGCLTGVLTGPVLVASTFSVFFATLLGSPGWSRAAIASAFSLYVMVYGLSGPAVGLWCEKLGPKSVLLSGAVLIAAGLASLGSVRHVWQFCLVYGLLGVTAGMTGIVPLTTLVFRWFAGDRGLAMGVASSGTVGGLFLAPLANFLIQEMGWRWAYFVLGIGAGCLLFVTVLATVQDVPPSQGQANQGCATGDRLQRTPTAMAADGAKSGDLTLGEALRTRSFWLLAGSGFFFLGALAGIVAHMVPLALDRGLARGAAALSLGLIIGIGPAGKVVCGYLADRYEPKKILTGSLLLQALAFLLVLRGGPAALLWTFVILFAIGQGGALAVTPVVVGDLFGSSSVGSLAGAYWLVATAGSLLFPPLAGVIREATGGYFPALLLFTACLFGAAGLAGVIRGRESSAGEPVVARSQHAALSP